MSEEELLKILNKEKSYTEEDLLLFIYDLRKQNTELKDNRNKLKEWLKEEIIKLDLYKDNIDIDEYVDKKFLLKKVLSKIQEIEGGTNV